MRLLEQAERDGTDLAMSAGTIWLTFAATPRVNGSSSIIPRWHHRDVVISMGVCTVSA